MSQKTLSPKTSLYRAEVIEKESRDYFEKASEKTDNPLTRRTFQIIAERHERRSERVEQALRATEAGQPSEGSQPAEEAAQPRPVFEEILRRIEQTTSPTADNIAELRDATVYAMKVRDVYAFLEQSAEGEAERELFASMGRDEDGLKTTLGETLDYLRSNFQISRLPKEA